MLEGFRVSRFIENEKAIDCLGPIHLVQLVQSISSSIFPGFGFGSIMLEGFRVSRFIENEKAIDCFGPLYTTQIILRVLLVFSETLFMTKNHTVSTHSI